VIQGLNRVGSWTGVAGKKHQEEPNKAGASPAETPEKRPGLFSRGTWGFGGKDETANHPNSDDDDDRRIRFTIGGAGRRLTKDDFLKEIQSLDPKARCEIITESDAPAAMKDMAKKDASRDSPGSSRVFEAKKPQVTSEKEVAKAVGAEVRMSMRVVVKIVKRNGYGGSVRRVYWILRRRGIPTPPKLARLLPRVTCLRMKSLSQKPRGRGEKVL
jgi:hypothetical protein